MRDAGRFRGPSQILLLTAVLVFVSAVAQYRTSAQGRGGASCPLTDVQTQKSIDAFKPIARFLTSEPRCLNCHGGVNPFINSPGLDPGDSLAPLSKFPHAGGLVRRQSEKAPDGTQLMEGSCMDCHNSMEKKAGGAPSVWTLAPSFLSFMDKDATTLCRQIKRSTQTADHFLGHIRDDNGGNAFGPTAFKGHRGLDPDQYDTIPNEPPSISHAALMQLAQNWVAAMGGSFKGDESCGCEFKHPNWSGQIHYALDMTYNEIHDEQIDSSHRLLSHITLTFTNGVGVAVTNAADAAESATRRPIAPGGYINESSRKSHASAGGSSPASVEVNVSASGAYSIQAGWKPVPGTSESVTCEYARSGASKCDTVNSPFFAEANLGQTNISEKTNDPNHVQGSKTETQPVGNGMRLWTVTWDLWRSN